MFKFHEGQLAHSEVQLEVLIDDYMFPAYTSPKIHSQTVKSSDIGEAFVRELEFSKLTLRLVSKDNPKDSSEENTVAKLTGDTLSTLQRILVSHHDEWVPIWILINMLHSSILPPSLSFARVAAISARSPSALGTSPCR